MRQPLPMTPTMKMILKMTGTMYVSGCSLYGRYLSSSFSSTVSTSPAVDAFNNVSMTWNGLCPCLLSPISPLPNFYLKELWSWLLSKRHKRISSFISAMFCVFSHFILSSELKALNFKSLIFLNSLLNKQMNWKQHFHINKKVKLKI